MRIAALDRDRSISLISRIRDLPYIRGLRGAK